LILLTISNSMGKRTSITLGTENWPPFSYTDKVANKISGISTEVINGTFKQMGITIERNGVYPWIRTQDMVYKGEIDAVYTASINDERKQYCYFPSEPIITSKWVLFIKKSKKDILFFQKLSDLKQKRIGLIRGYNYPLTFTNYIKGHSFIQEVSQETQNIVKLIMDRFDYMPALLETTLYLAENSLALKKMAAYDKLYYFPTPLATTDFYLIFSKKTVEKSLVDQFSKALIEFKKTADYLKIIQKYQKIK